MVCRVPKLPILTIFLESEPGQRSRPPKLARVPWETSAFLRKADQIWDFGQKMKQPNAFGGRGAQKDQFFSKMHLFPKESAQAWVGVSIAPARSLKILSKSAV